MEQITNEVIKVVKLCKDLGISLDEKELLMLYKAEYKDELIQMQDHINELKEEKQKIINENSKIYNETKKLKSDLEILLEKFESDNKIYFE